MGYKGAFRTLSASSARASRELEREERKREREQEAFQKKTTLVQEKIDKILESLDEIYASGKINDAKHRDLSKRKADISYDLVILGKSAGVTLGKRYMIGDITKEEFEKIKRNIMPPRYFKEKEYIDKTIEYIDNQVTKYIQNCKDSPDDKCQSCKNDGSFLNPLKKVDELTLCGACRRKLKKLSRFQGYSGQYLVAQQAQISPGTKVPCAIKQEHY